LRAKNSSKDVQKTVSGLITTMLLSLTYTSDYMLTTNCEDADFKLLMYLGNYRNKLDFSYKNAKLAEREYFTKLLLRTTYEDE